MAPPRSRALARFFVSDYRELAMHIAEATVTFMILLFWCLSDDERGKPVLSFWAFLPFAVASLVPMCKLCVGRPSWACLANSLVVLRNIALTPFFIIWAVCTLVWR